MVLLEERERLGPCGKTWMLRHYLDMCMEAFISVCAGFLFLNHCMHGDVCEKINPATFCSLPVKQGSSWERCQRCQFCCPKQFPLTCSQEVSTTELVSLYEKESLWKKCFDSVLRVVSHLYIESVPSLEAREKISRVLH